MAALREKRLTALSKAKITACSKMEIFISEIRLITYNKKAWRDEVDSYL